MRIIRRIFFITITTILTLFTTKFIQSEGIEVSEYYEFSPIPSNVYYESLTSNTGITHREAINNVWYNLEQEGYELASLNADQFYIDVQFSNDSDLWRYVYDVESNYIMFFNNEYESSYIGESYINEGKENR